MGKRITLGAILLLLLLAAVPRAGSPRGTCGFKGKANGDEEQARLLATGKKIFVERCAKCHDAGGDKPLRTGPPLSKRELSDDEIARAVAGRLKDAPDEEKRAVTLYVSRFMKRK